MTSYSSHDRTQRSVNYEGHPPTCTCADCLRRKKEAQDLQKKEVRDLRRSTLVANLLIIGLLLLGFFALFAWIIGWFG